MTDKNKRYLWINLADLADLGTIQPLGSPLNLMIQSQVGDKLLPGAYYSKKCVDDIFVIVVSSPTRCDAIRAALDVIATRKLISVSSVGSWAL